MTEGQLSHRLMQARELTEGRKDLEPAQFFIDAALQLVREIHREGT